MTKNSKIAILITLVVAAAMPFIVPFNNYWMNILLSFCYFSICASSLNLLLGYTGQVSMGHNAFMCIGAYSYGIFCVNYQFVGSQIIGFLLGLAIPFLFGLFIGVGCSRLSAIFLAMATGAFAKALKAFIIAEAWLTGGPNGLTKIPKMKLFGMDKLPVAEYDRILYFIMIGVTFVVILCCWRLINSRIGRAFRAINTSPIAAASMGINVTGYKLLVCGISAAMAGLSGVFYAWNLSYVSADMFDKMGVKLMTMAVAGGMSTIPGPIVGAVVMGYLPELLRTFGGHLEGIYGLLIISVFLFIPTGLYGAFRNLAAWVGKKFKKPAESAAGEGE
ncbi:MAG: branched-chain amino acid ABC transporter permease [Oscillospiraceae bacterium]|nr:branched-chain amino acid ABC transporter permease [Oscillospiraceae bacterium]